VNNIEDEQSKTLSGLQFAIQMEITGKEYYQKASQESSDVTGKELFKWLAAEEDKHRLKFEQIYQAVKDKKGWPDVSAGPGEGKIFSNLFSQVFKAADNKSNVAESELPVIKKAIDMEKKTHDFYKTQREKASYDEERGFYEAIAAEEWGHYLALIDYREYIIDPDGWFLKAEHHSLDGG